MKKNVAIAILSIVVVTLLGVIWNLRQTYNLRLYAIENNCTWSATGSMYGDDRDYVCK